MYDTWVLRDKLSPAPTSCLPAVIQSDNRVEPSSKTQDETAQPKCFVLKSAGMSPKETFFGRHRTCGVSLSKPKFSLKSQSCPVGLVVSLPDTFFHVDASIPEEVPPPHGCWGNADGAVNISGIERISGENS